MPDLSTIGCLPRLWEYNLIPVKQTRQRTLKEQLQHYLFLTLASLLGLAAGVYLLDYAIFKIRAATNHNAYGSVVVNHYYAVGEKSGKTEFMFDPPQPRTCVNALFPHEGAMPCWYLSRHPDQRTDI